MLKRLLRFVPRRAMLHKYPLIGRFAEHLRPRGYLWSFRRVHVRRAYYAGAVIAFLPLMGIQLPLAAFAALVLRCNLMLLAGLQLLTNPLTAGPIYYATHQLGAAVISQFQSTADTSDITDERESAVLGGYVAESLGEPLSDRPSPVRWTVRARNAIAAMVVGGTILGGLLALLLDAVDVLVRKIAPHHEPKHRRHRVRHRHPAGGPPRRADQPGPG